MTSIDRFIQFNNETIEARQLLHYENLAKALTKNMSLSINERKLIEFNPNNRTISISVFWRHRDAITTEAGRLSDIYLMTEGFWKHFNVRDWSEFLQDRETKLPKLMDQIIFCLEEFRLQELIQRKRVGTSKYFKVRTETYLIFHKQQLRINLQKGFLAEAYISYLYICLHEGTLKVSGPELFEQTNYSIQSAYESHSTEDSINLGYQLLGRLQEIEQDLLLPYYAIISSELLPSPDFFYHAGTKDKSTGETEKKETIEELFRSWHRESQEENGVHLRYELEHGNNGKTIGNPDAEEGREDQEITEVGQGRSIGSKEQKENMETSPAKKDQTKKKANKEFGSEHVHVVYREERINSSPNNSILEQLQSYRLEQAPYVKAFVQEIRKRMEQKKIARRENLMKGRLSSRLMNLWTEDRPKPFYKKDAPSVKLDAVFGLLVDGSASMSDKMEETKKAVLLFHDVLLQLGISHEIVLHYEDAFEASEEEQPNVFKWVHKLEDGQKDSGLAIMSLEAHEDNRDGFAIRWIGKRLSSRNEKHKFLLVFSDGEPSAFGYAQNGIKDTAEAVLEQEKRNISVLHLFLNDREASEEQLALFQLIYGKKTATASSLSRFTEETLRILKKMLHYVVKSQQ